MQTSSVGNVETMNEMERASSPAASASIRSLSNTAVLGDVAWLMMESNRYRGRRVHEFARLVMPPIGLQQFRLFHDGDVPIAYLSWALLSGDAEARYLVDPTSLEPADWSSGNTAYIVDFLVSKKALKKILPYLKADPIFTSGKVRGLKTRNGIRMLIELAAKAESRRLKVTHLP